VFIDLVSSGQNEAKQVSQLFYFASAAVAVDSSILLRHHLLPGVDSGHPSNLVNGHVSTMRFIVCRWPQSQKGDLARPHLCKLALTCLDSRVGNNSVVDHRSRLPVLSPVRNCVDRCHV